MEPEISRFVPLEGSNIENEFTEWGYRLYSGVTDANIRFLEKKFPVLSWRKGNIDRETLFEPSYVVGAVGSLPDSEDFSLLIYPTNDTLRAKIRGIHVIDVNATVKMEDGVGDITVVCAELRQKVLKRLDGELKRAQRKMEFVSKLYGI